MNLVALRVFVLREVTALVVVAVFILLVSDPPSRLIEALFFVPFATFGVILNVFSDRKVAVRAGRGDDPWNGPYATWNQLTWSGSRNESAAEVGRQAIVNLGGSEATLVNETTAVGWIGSNFPFFQEHQIAVEANTETPGQTLFTCCARPRWSPLFLIVSMGGLRNRRLVDSLQAELQRLIT